MSVQVDFTRENALRWSSIPLHDDCAKMCMHQQLTRGMGCCKAWQYDSSFSLQLTDVHNIFPYYHYGPTTKPTFIKRHILHHKNNMC
jgi:hypothetical protein